MESERAVDPSWRIDLHAHSSRSDGTEPPSGLVAASARAGLDVIAITDHDTTDGWAEASAAALAHGIGLVPGIELSTRQDGFSVHLLAFLPDPANADLVAELERIRTSRRERAQAIVERLARDYPLDWDGIVQLAAGGTIGRPHIADALVARGYVADRYEAFDRILHPRHGYVMPVHAPSPLEGVELVRAAGGVPVLAHPGTSTRDRVVPIDRLRRLQAAGLFGLELDHPENSAAGKSRIRELAAETGLAVTGGSDWHGAGKVNRLGDGLTAPDVFERMLAEAHGTPAVGIR